MKENRKRNIWIWIGATVLALILVAFVVAQIVIPPMVEEKFDTALKSFFADAKELQIDVSSTPAIKMAFGRFDSVVVNAEDFMIEDIPITSLTVSAKNLIINKDALESENPIGNADITMVMTTQQVKERFISQIPSLNNLEVNFSQDQISVLGAMNVFGLALEIEASGTLIVLPDNIVSFDIEEVNVENSSLGSAVLSIVKELINFQFSLGELPWGIKLQEIDITQDYITFYGYMKN